jgi:hypothetical protein
MTRAGRPVELILMVRTVSRDLEYIAHRPADRRAANQAVSGFAFPIAVRTVFNHLPLFLLCNHLLLLLLLCCYCY